MCCLSAVRQVATKDAKGWVGGSLKNVNVAKDDRLNT